jgi:hypothetical protein
MQYYRAADVCRTAQDHQIVLRCSAESGYGPELLIRDVRCYGS